MLLLLGMQTIAASVKLMVGVSFISLGQTKKKLPAKVTQKLSALNASNKKTFEQEILNELLLLGISKAEIAAETNISVKTVSRILIKKIPRDLSRGQERWGIQRGEMQFSPLVVLHELTSCSTKLL